MFEAHSKMRAIALTHKVEVGHVAENLRMVDVPIPRPEPDEVLIKLAASSMHIDEIYAAQGTALGRFFGPKHISEKSPYILGSSVSGTIAALGTDVEGFVIGEDVIVIPNEKMENGSWATYRRVPQRMVLRKPKQLTHVQAAAVTMAACVAWGAIEKGDVNPNDRCLVIGASGAIGNLLVQMLKSKGAYVTGVCSDRNTSFVLDKGADAVVDYTKECFGDAGKETYDRVFDTLGGLETERDAYRVLTKAGRFVTIVGPLRHIGEERLSRPKVGRVIGYVLWRSCVSRLAGPRYVFGERLPKNTIRPALDYVVRRNIQMPIEAEIPFQPSEIKLAIKLLTSHRGPWPILQHFGTLEDPDSGQSGLVLQLRQGLLSIDLLFQRDQLF